MSNKECFDENGFTEICRKLAKQNIVFKNIIDQYGIPPFFNRKPGFATLVLIILEQQVSLASARASYNKLVAKIGTVTPQRIITLTDDELRGCYFSRQKILYVRGVANAIINKTLNLNSLSKKTNAEVYADMIKLKGIGPWTIDVYLMICLQRADMYPLGDVALVNSMKHEMKLAKDTTKTELEIISARWAPYRTIAAFLFWHAYIVRKNIQYLP